MRFRVVGESGDSRIRVRDHRRFSPKQHGRRLACEPLEDRRLLSIEGAVALPIPQYTIGGYGYQVYVHDSAHDGSRLYHGGEDVRASATTPVHAIADGVVRYSGSDTYYGNVVVVEHTRPDHNSFISIYGHLSPNGLIQSGSLVNLQDSLGFVGYPEQNGGYVPHLHFQVLDGPYVDNTYASIGADLNSSRYPYAWSHLLRPSNVIGDWNFGRDSSGDGSELFTTNGWQLSHGLTEAADVSPHTAWRLNPDAERSDPYVISEGDLRLSANYIDSVKVSVKSNVPGASSNRDMQLFYRLRLADGTITSFSDQDSVRATNVPYGQYAEVVFDLRGENIPAKAEIYQLRLDPATAGIAESSDTVEIDWIRAYHEGRPGGLAPTQFTVPASGAGSTLLQFEAYNAVVNSGQTTSKPSTAVFYASDDPALNGAAYELARRPVESLSVGYQSQATTSLPITGLPSSVLSQGRVYLAMAIDPAKSPNAGDLDWLEVPLDPTTLKPDLTGVDFDIEPRPMTYGWGQTVTVSYYTVNQGEGYAHGPFSNGVYLSHDTVWDSGDVLLKRDSYDGIAAHASFGTAFDVTLPSSPPPGFPSGAMYLILAADDGQALDESNETNNSGVGYAVDYRDVVVSGTPPTPGAPTIGSFVASPSTAIRGSYITLIADNVTDDNYVGPVRFFIDANGNGNLDSDDRYVADGSKSYTTFSSRVNTIGWPLGDVTLFAQAEDNYGNLSLVKSTYLTLQGVGPAVEDAYEHNDTFATATNIGGGPGTFQVDNLSITQSDEDFFAFDIPSGRASIQVKITFNEEAPQNGPVGDLALELFDPDGRTIGFSDLSQAGSTSELISVARYEGRYTARVFGQTVMGVGGTDTNSNYTFRVTVAPDSGYPFAQTLTATPNPVRSGDTVTLTLSGVTTYGGTSISSYGFYRDANGNGIVDADQEWLGYGNWKTDEHGNEVWWGPTSTWPAGTSKVFAHVSDSLGRLSIANSCEVQMIANFPPVISSVLAPLAVMQNESFTIVAQDVSDDEAVSEVRFFVDSNTNGVLDAADASVGTGVQAGSSWSCLVATSGLPLGMSLFFVQAADNRASVSMPVSASVVISEVLNQAPVIGSLLGPTSVADGASFTLQATNVTDPDGTVGQVVFYLDDNLDGVLNASDVSLGTGTQDGTNWLKTIAPTKWLLGQTMLFVEASDDGQPSLKTVRPFSLTVLNGAPVAGADTFSTGEDALLTVAAPGVLSNDEDPEGDSLAAVVVDGPLHGSLTLNPDGSFNYAPNPNYYGQDRFTYSAFDGLLNSDTATVTISVGARRDFDVDVNGKAEPLTDGLVILRYMFGFVGHALVRGVIAADAARTSPDVVAAVLDQVHNTMLDVDGNQEVDGLSDGILILRYLFGFTGKSLVNKVLAPGATRTDPEVVTAFLEGYMPASNGKGTARLSQDAKGTCAAIAADSTPDEPLSTEAAAANVEGILRGAALAALSDQPDSPYPDASTRFPRTIADISTWPHSAAWAWSHRRPHGSRRPIP
jgi:hypothetical protein